MRKKQPNPDNQTKTRRLYLTMPEGIVQDLEVWAEQEKNKPLALAAFILETEVRKAREQGVFKPSTEHDKPVKPESNYETLTELVMNHLPQLLKSKKFSQERLKDLINGQKPTELEALRLALLCGFSEDYVYQLVNK